MSRFTPRDPYRRQVRQPQQPRPPVPQNKGKPAGQPPQAKKPKSKGVDTSKTWFGRFTIPKYQTGVNAQVAIFEQAKRLMPSIFNDDMETLLVGMDGLSNLEWQLLHHMIVKLMKMSQRLKIKIAEQDANINGDSDAKLAARKAQIEKRLTAYLASVKVAHAADKTEAEAEKKAVAAAG